jgi:hypothetical protein
MIFLLFPSLRFYSLFPCHFHFNLLLLEMFNSFNLIFLLHFTLPSLKLLLIPQIHLIVFEDFEFLLLFLLNSKTFSKHCSCIQLDWCLYLIKVRQRPSMSLVELELILVFFQDLLLLLLELVRSLLSLELKSLLLNTVSFVL